jgi:ribonuclease HI
MMRRVKAGSVRRQWLESLGESTVYSVTFIFVRGHVDISGNERADILAGLATVANGQRKDRADIVNALRQLWREENFEGSESTLLLE